MCALPTAAGSDRPAWAGVPPVVWIPVLFLLSRLTYGVVWLVWAQLFPGIDGSILESFSRWDADWYDKIMRYGYSLPPIPSGQATFAFFPAYPLVVSGLHQLWPLDLRLLSMVVSNAFALVFLLTLFEFGRLRFGRRVAELWVLLYLWGPLSFYLSIEYTEAMYLALLSLGLLAAHRKQWLLLGLAGAVLSATRMTGVLLLVYAAAQVLLEPGPDGRINPVRNLAAAFTNLELVAGMMLIPVGLGLFVLHLSATMGDGLAFVHIQRAWDYEHVGPTNLLNSNPLVSIYQGFADAGLSNKLKAAAAVIGIGAGGWLAWKKLYPESLFVFLTVLPSLFRSVHSTPRYVFNALFVYLLLSLWAARRGRGTQRTLVAALAAVGLGLVFNWFTEY